MEVIEENDESQLLSGASGLNQRDIEADSSMNATEQATTLSPERKKTGSSISKSRSFAVYHDDVGRAGLYSMNAKAYTSFQELKASADELKRYVFLPGVAYNITCHILLYNEPYCELRLTICSVIANVKHAGGLLGRVKVCAIVDGKKKMHKKLLHDLYSDFVPNEQSVKWEYEDVQEDTEHENFVMTGDFCFRDYDPLDFSLIIKNENLKKAHSHCLGACIAEGKQLVYVDCGTILESNLMFLLTEALENDDQLVAVTGVQRTLRAPEWVLRATMNPELLEVMLNRDDGPGELFDANGIIINTLGWFAGILGPIQACEFRIGEITWRALDEIGCLPVLPGPCQMYDLGDLQHFCIIEKYWELTHDPTMRFHLPEWMGASKKLELLCWANVRIVEDRILSYLSFAATRKRTQSIPDAMFYFDAHLVNDELFEQRRRWNNGTILFYFWVLLKQPGTRLTGKRDFINQICIILQLWQISMCLFVPPLIMFGALYGAEFYETQIPKESQWLPLTMSKNMGLVFGFGSIALALLFAFISMPCFLGMRKGREAGRDLRGFWDVYQNIALYFNWACFLFVLMQTFTYLINVYNPFTGPANDDIGTPVGGLPVQLTVLYFMTFPFIYTILLGDLKGLTAIGCSYIQYALSLPWFTFYVNFYSICNLHNISWGVVEKKDNLEGLAHPERVSNIAGFLVIFGNAALCLFYLSSLSSEFGNPFGKVLIEPSQMIFFIIAIHLGPMVISHVLYAAYTIKQYTIYFSNKDAVLNRSQWRELNRRSVEYDEAFEAMLH
jgi:cellulose synthase/poly-beta-1,6-N-acetylglucosamine synthase-like glycosyltransferase